MSPPITMLAAMLTTTLYALTLLVAAGPLSPAAAFDALVEHHQADHDEPDQLLEEKLLVAVGRPDLARTHLAWQERACAAHEAWTTPERCAAIGALLASLPPRAASVEDAALLARLKEPALAAGYLEVPAPAGVARKGAQVTIPGVARVVFASIEGQRAGAIAISRDLDPRGEVSAGGVVVYLSKDAGKHWDGPYPTGFALGFPYFVRSSSTAPLFRAPPHSTDDSDVELQIPVDVRAIDPASITFPPVGLATTRSKRDQLVRIPLAQLVRDSDDDGLTDLTEERLATDRRSADTDHDGTPDAFDALPLDPTAPAGDGAGRFLLAALNAESPPAALVHEPGGSLPSSRVVDAPRALRTRFVGPHSPLVELPGRTIRLSDTALEAYGKKLGPIYPMDVEVVVSPDGKRAIIDVEESWRGVTYLVEEGPGGALAVRELSSWVS